MHPDTQIINILLSNITKYLNNEMTYMYTDMINNFTQIQAYRDSHVPCINEHIHTHTHTHIHEHKHIHTQMCA